MTYNILEKIDEYFAHRKIWRSRPYRSKLHRFLSTQLTNDVIPECSGGSIFHPLFHIDAKNSHKQMSLQNTLPSGVFQVLAMSRNFTRTFVCIAKSSNLYAVWISFNRFENLTSRCLTLLQFMCSSYKASTAQL